MRWISSMNRQTVLPILLGISITTFGLSVAILLYSMLGKDDNDNKKKHNQIATTRRKEISVKVTILEKYVPSIIGKGGTVIKNIEGITNTRIKMENRNVYSLERVCHILSDDMKNIQSAQSMIQTVIENVPIIETFYLSVPHEIFKKVFKKNVKGTRIEFQHELQKTYGVKISIDEVYKPHMESKIKIQGTADQIASAVIHIEEKINEEVEAQAQLSTQFAAKFASSSNNTDMYKNTIFGEYNVLSESTDDSDKNIIEDTDIETYEILMPHEVFNKFVDRSGYDIQEVVKSSGAKLMVRNTAVRLQLENFEMKNVIIVRGTAAQVKLAISQIESKIQEENRIPIELMIKRVSELSESPRVHNIPNLALVQDGLMEVFVTAMETPNLFWIQVLGPAHDQLQKLIHEMTNYYYDEENRKFHILNKITPGKMVAAKFKDNKWYRAEIISMESDELCEVFFVDYGDMDLVPIDDVLELRTDMLSLRHQAVECSLANVKPRENEWSSEAINKFAELTYLAKEIKVTAKVKGYKEHPVDCKGSRNRQSSLIPCIALRYESDSEVINIGDCLVQLKMAQVEEERLALTLLYAVYGVLGGRRYIAIPVDGIDGIDVIEVNPIASSLSRVSRQTEAYVPVAISNVAHQDNSEVQRSERSATRVLDYVDFGGHTGSNGAFSWYADYPAHRL
ncbi:uncharacterized protein LOC105203366 isoform X1 [Solenopsis invicta]|uniref:uncharacterized protein LOC105203366 isoform X1 n=1 Tax=Solenopsis invicta TaxID=13686 RepID=UPI00193EAC0A|nr:uncharacterized protein LOC105203366 isoform X1 [Solenopsis invicta]XP_011170456.2 uncharacterized protein LOC105203366 isoform X1 [Solenopsis invicta]XP_025996992.2 uncharacterized protein LOC105203366 isoform X1 [Solenopsis invicta]XP_039311207.1 uncharacterized protein LOC105203366 isoform X1 [Solenopsis invicta]